MHSDEDSLRVNDAHGNRTAVLSGKGIGAFKPRYGALPELWARAAKPVSHLQIQGTSAFPRGYASKYCS